MFIRVKLIALYLAAVLILLLSAQLFVIAPLHDNARARVTDDVNAAAAAAAALDRADVAAIRATALGLARQDALVEAMARTCQPEENPADCAAWRHQNARGALEQWIRSQQSLVERNRSRSLGARDVDGLLGDSPTLVVVADPTGTVVARAVGDTADWWGESVQNLRAYAVVQGALERGLSHDVMSWREGSGAEEAGTLMLTAAAPVVLPGQGGAARSLGVVLLGTPLNDQMARDRQSVMGDVDFAYTVGNQVRGSSLRPEDARALRRATFRAAGGGEELDFDGFLTSPSARSGVFRAHGEGRELLAARGTFAGDRVGEEGAGYVVVADLGAALAPVRRGSVVLPAVGIALLLLGGLGIMLLVRGFMAPVVTIDQGLQQVIAGNRDYVWDTNSPNSFTNEMARSLNVMSAFLQGKPLPDEEEPKNDSEWAALLEFADVGMSGGRSAVAGIPPSEFQRSPSGHHETIPMSFRRVFDEYVAARRRVDPDAEPVTYDRFVRQLERNAAAFKQKHECDEVRFQVVVRDGKVLLKPIPIIAEGRAE
jgi:hypothetical protein